MENCRRTRILVVSANSFGEEGHGGRLQSARDCVEVIFRDDMCAFSKGEPADAINLEPVVRRSKEQRCSSWSTVGLEGARLHDPHQGGGVGALGYYLV